MLARVILSQIKPSFLFPRICQSSGILQRIPKNFSLKPSLVKTISNESFSQGRIVNRTLSSFPNHGHLLVVAYRSIHLTHQNRIPPLIWMILRPVVKMSAVLSGRGFRKWWRNLPKDKKSYFKKVVYEARMKILYTITGLTLLFSLNYMAHLQDTPITGRRRFIAFTKSQYQKIAQFEAELQLAQHSDKLLPEKHLACRTIENIALRLCRANSDINDVKSMKFHVAVINDDSNVNAFVLPTGHIFVFTGLLKMMQNEDQLAVVLGHEMAHAVLSHGAELVSRAQLIDILVIVVMAAIWAFLPHDGIALVAHWFYNKVVQLILELPYSRSLELEADEVGLLLASKACYDVREAPVFWSVLSAQSRLNEDEQIEWLSTHPSHDNRAERLNAMMDQALETRDKCRCPKLGKDPRDAIADLSRMVILR